MSQVDCRLPERIRNSSLFKQIRQSFCLYFWCIFDRINSSGSLLLSCRIMLSIHFGQDPVTLVHHDLFSQISAPNYYLLLLYTVSQKNWTLFHLSITFANTVLIILILIILSLMQTEIICLQMHN